MEVNLLLLYHIQTVQHTAISKINLLDLSLFLVADEIVVHPAELFANV
jgi:hypothetical protein